MEFSKVFNVGIIPLIVMCLLGASSWLKCISIGDIVENPSLNIEQNNINYKEDSITIKEKVIKKIINNWLYEAKDSLESISKDLKIQKAFKERDREELKKLCIPLFEKLKKDGVEHFQFHVSPATSFLRLHSIKKFGDDLSPFRFTVVECNKDKKIVIGLEEGKGGYGLTVVIPMYYEGKYTGSVELGMGLDDKFLKERIQSKLKGEYFIYQYDSNRIRWEVTGNEYVRGLLARTTDKEDNYKVTQGLIYEVVKTKKAKYEISDDRKNIILIIPLEDYKGNIGGYIKAVYNKEQI